jgi:long-subunit fatty acid transport protein
MSHAVEVSSSFNPVGSGARAAGMGGAFIAIADDATAASWNPAGLVHLEKPEFSFVYGYFNRTQSFGAESHPELPGGGQSMDASGINYASAAYPFTLFNRNMVVSLNYQRLYDMNKEYRLDYTFPQPQPNPNNDSLQFKPASYKQTGYLSTITPAIAMQIIPEIYVGVAVNIWDDFLGTSSWNTTFTSVSTGSVGGNPYSGSRTTSDKFSFSGVNMTAGVLVTLDKFNIGGVFKSPFTATVKHETNKSSSDNFSGVRTSSIDEMLKWDMPMSVGVGVAYRFSDSWTVGLDAHWTQWSQFFIVTPDGGESNPLSPDKLISETRLKDTTQVRLGTEYLIIMDKVVIPLRAGLFYDPQPGVLNGKATTDEFYGCSLGSGYTFGDYSFDLAYQLRIGTNVSAPEIAPDVTSDVTHHTVMASLIYRF